MVVFHDCGIGQGAKERICNDLGDFFQLPPVVTDNDRDLLMQWWPGNDEGYAFKSRLWAGMGFEPHVLTEVMRQNDPEFIDQLNRARVGDRGCVAYFNERSISDRKRAPENDLWLCATNRMASTINDERVSALEVDGAQARTYVASVSGDVKPSDKPTDDKLRLIEGARVMLLANMPDDGLANGSLGTVVETGIGSVTVLFDDTGLEVEIEPKQWKVMKTTVHESIGKDGKPVQELENDVVGTFTQIPLRLAFAITIHKSQGQTFERCAVHSKVFGAGMLYVALSRCTTFDGLTVWPKIESRALILLGLLLLLVVCLVRVGREEVVEHVARRELAPNGHTGVTSQKQAVSRLRRLVNALLLLLGKVQKLRPLHTVERRLLEQHDEVGVKHNVSSGRVVQHGRGVLCDARKKQTELTTLVCETGEIVEYRRVAECPSGRSRSSSC